MSSTRTTASAPAGITAPVDIAQASPAPTVTPAGAPARDSSTIRSSTPAPLSLARTAKPSIAELSNGGTSPGARTSSASTRPSASARSTVSGASGGAQSSTTERASSNSISFAATGMATLVRAARIRTGRPSSPTAILQAVSKNLVELVRRTHERSAPTALEVLKEAVEQRGEVTDEDRRAAAAASGLPEAAVYGVSTFYDDLLAPRGRRHLRVCTGTSCFATTANAHVDELRDALGLELGERRDDGSVSLAETVCLGFCHSSPAIRDGDLIDAGDAVVERILAGGTRGASEPEWRSVLAEPVLIRPGTWSGFEHALARHTPESLLEEVKAARVRGRGGAGFPAGDKWAFARASPGEQKFIVANGDEGDPGSYIDKYLMERNPALVLEGMALAGYAVGADHGFVLTRSEYPLSKPALEQAAASARAGRTARRGHSRQRLLLRRHRARGSRLLRGR